MCYSNCPYERSDGECKGTYKGRKDVVPHCWYGTDKEWNEYVTGRVEDEVERRISYVEYTGKEGISI
jgi:hypothetical protein